MNANGLTREELAHYAPIDAEVAAYVAEHARELLEETEDFYDPAGCYDDGFSEGEDAGRKCTLEHLAETYGEDLLEWIDKVPNIALAGGADPNELQTLLSALHAEFEAD